MSTAKKILIVRLSAIGDIVMAAPVARALKAANAETEIHWLAESACLSLIQNDPCITKTLVWPRKQWTTLWKEKRYTTLYKTIKAFKHNLQAEQYDLVIDLQGLLKSGLLSYLSGAKTKIGLGSREGSQWFMDKIISRTQGNQDLIGSEYRTIIETLAPGADYTLALASSSEANVSANNKLAELNLQRPFIALCPFTTRPQKHWINTHWRSVIKTLSTSKQYDVLILGGPDDSAKAKALSAGLNTYNLAGKTSLQEAGLIIAKAAAVIGVDTGLTHMGHAANIPTVAIFGSTRPYLDAEKPGSHIIYQDRHCSPCKRQPSCNGAFDCMHEITPEKVLTELDTALFCTGQSQ